MAMIGHPQVYTPCCPILVYIEYILQDLHGVFQSIQPIHMTIHWRPRGVLTDLRSLLVASYTSMTDRSLLYVNIVLMGFLLLQRLPILILVGCRVEMAQISPSKQSRKNVLADRDQQ